jgi:lipopolysaccharide biosynthesis glycosyltransferase
MSYKKNILFCTIFDDGFIDGGLTMIYSLTKNVPDFLNYSHKIFVSDFCILSDENRDKVRKLLPDVIFEEVNQEVYSKIKVRHEHCRPSFLTIDIFKQREYDIVCYFDADMLCVKDITEGLEKAREYDFVAHCQRNASTTNGGFLIINNNILQSNTYERMIYYMNNVMLGNYISRLEDQEVLNAGLLDEFKWFDLTKLYNFRDFAKKGDWSDFEKAKIIHWSGAMPKAGEMSVPKPWHENALKEKATDIWRKYNTDMKKEFKL